MSHHGHSHGPSDPPPDPEQLLRKEGQFWDLQEERIDSLYARPHDWRFVPHLADVIIAPRVRTLLRILDAHRSEVSSLLDIGCGNGWFCHATAKRGIRSIGVDLSEKKIETARRMAKEQGVDHLCEFWAGDVMKWQPEQRVDLLTSHGSLHHFPGFQVAMEHMVENFMRPDGYMLFVEPNHEGMSPETRKFLLAQATGPLAPHFDFEFYREVTGDDVTGGATRPTARAAIDVDIRDESPAGKEFFGEHIELDEYFERHFDVIEKEFYHLFSSHASNAFYVFMKSPWVRRMWQHLLPKVVARDTALLEDPEHQRWAEDGLWFMQRKGVRR
ncbi:MAG: methyltransferase domain-containing protein [Planctomycetes bacterium]|nr:methyltransferase domain-containing protein [Planctomycetota bacterium]